MNRLQILAVSPVRQECFAGVPSALGDPRLPLEVEVAPPIPAALRTFKDRPFHAAFFEIGSPEDLNVFRQIRQELPGVPFVLLAEPPESHALRSAPELGAIAVIARQASPDVVARTLQEAARLQALLSEQRAATAANARLSEEIVGLVKEAKRLVADATRHPAIRSKLSDFFPALVEDDSDQALLLLRGFAKARLPGPSEVLKDGEEAIAYLSGTGEFADRRRHPLPSLLILDLNMPRKNGFEVLEWMRAQPRFATLPVVVLSSSQAPADRERALALGANLYLQKPFGLDGLIETARAIVGLWTTRTTRTP